MTGLDDIPDLVPARMLNEFVYCPRLMWLEWVQGDFADNADTVEGRYAHRRVDIQSGEVPDAVAMEEEDRIHARSVLLSGENVGLIARIDLLEGSNGKVVPVDYKLGAAPDIPAGAWEPDRVQICAQGLILRENGYVVDEGVIYYVASKQRIPVPIDELLEARTLDLLSEMRHLVAKGAIPGPLTDSPKCPRCSLVGICLPDEVTMLTRTHPPAKKSEVRRLVPARSDALPLYLQSQGITLGKSGDVLVVRERGQILQEIRAIDVSEVVLFGNVQITAQALHLLCEREIPICHFSYGGWFYGLTEGTGHKNVELRLHQYRAHADAQASLVLARSFVTGKIHNCRTLLRRNGRNVAPEVLQELHTYAERSRTASSTDELLGIEGMAAKIYFSQFNCLLNPRDNKERWTFHFDQRSRRPPRDPINALMSFAYALLTKDFMLTTRAVGFDPFLGFYHRPRYGRPALALDLMEEFRPLICDSIVVSVVNTGEIASRDFIGRAGSTALTSSGRKTFLRAYGRRMDALITHPVFGYKVSYRRILEIQARLLGRWLSGEITDYPPFMTR